MGKEIAKQKNPLVSLLINVVIPVVILNFLGKNYLGPKRALVVALLFPIIYGLYVLVKERKADFMSIIGIVSVALTGVVGISGLPKEYMAIKEALIPLVLGLVMVISLKTPFPLIKKIMMTEALFDVKRLTGALKEKETEGIFEKRLVGFTWGFASAMFLSAVLNYILVMIVLNSPPNTPEYNAELGKIMWMGLIVVLIPSMAIMIWVLNKLFDTLMELTGLKLDDLLAAHHKEKSVVKPDPQVD